MEKVLLLVLSKKIIDLNYLNLYNPNSKNIYAVYYYDDILQEDILKNYKESTLSSIEKEIPYLLN